MQHLPENVHFAFRAVYVVEAAPQIQLKCPLCRAVEPVKSAEELKEEYPDAYLEWMEFELHRDDWDNTFSYSYETHCKMVRSNMPKPSKHINNRRAKKLWRGHKM